MHLRRTRICGATVMNVSATTRLPTLLPRSRLAFCLDRLFAGAQVIQQQSLHFRRFNRPRLLMRPRGRTVLTRSNSFTQLGNLSWRAVTCMPRKWTESYAFEPRCLAPTGRTRAEAAPEGAAWSDAQFWICLLPTRRRHTATATSTSPAWPEGLWLAVGSGPASPRMYGNDTVANHHDTSFRSSTRAATGLCAD